MVCGVCIENNRDVLGQIWQNTCSARHKEVVAVFIVFFVDTVCTELAVSLIVVYLEMFILQF